MPAQTAAPRSAGSVGTGTGPNGTGPTGGSPNGTGPTGGSQGHATADGPAPDEAGVDPIPALRTRIDAVDAEIIQLWRERAALSRQVGAARVASGGTRLVLAREQQIVEKFRDALGDEGAPLAMLLLRAGRGRL